MKFIYNSVKHRKPQNLLALCISSFSINSYAVDTEFDLESLMQEDIKITSAMKRTQSSKDTPASTYVLSNEQLRKSGVQTLPEMLRLIPGVQVRHRSNSQLAISIRHPGSAFTSNILVMIDGHSIYNPGFNSSYWELTDIAPENIERIEVIRGQTGAVWGLNAGNGVINIITKQNLDHQHQSASIQARNTGFVDSNINVGTTINSHSTIRFHAGHRNSPSAKEGDGIVPANDALRVNTLGLRADIVPNDDTYAFIKVDYTDGAFDATTRLANPTTGQALFAKETVHRDRLTAVGRVEHQLSSTKDHMLQINISDFNGNQLTASERYLSVDIDYQMNTLWKQHQIDWGLTYRYNDIAIANDIQSFDIGAVNHSETFGGFAQAQLNFYDDKFQIFLANLSAHNNFTGWEHQPAIRMLINPNSDHTLWSSVSRAVSAPSYISRNILGRLEGTPFSRIQPTGIDAIDSFQLESFFENNKELDAQTTVSTELGYRFQTSYISIGTNLFYSETSNAQSINTGIRDLDFQEFQENLLQGQIINAINQLDQARFVGRFINGSPSRTYGGELTAKWKTTEKLSTEISYSLVNLDYGQSNIISIPVISRNSSLKQTMLTLDYGVSQNHNLFLSLRYEDGASYNTKPQTNYHFNWLFNVTENIDISLIANILDSHDKFEFQNDLETQSFGTERDSYTAINTRFTF